MVKEQASAPGLTAWREGGLAGTASGREATAKHLSIADMRGQGGPKRKRSNAAELTAQSLNTCHRQPDSRCQRETRGVTGKESRTPTTDKTADAGSQGLNRHQQYLRAKEFSPH